MALKDRRAARARQLRRQPTDAERLLWSRLRNRAVDGAKFRRQTPLGPFIVDFFCAEARLVVEVDGGQHAENIADARRDAWLAANGCAVARYWNHEVLGNLDGVLEDIRARLIARREAPLTPTRSPEGEKGRGGEAGAGVGDGAPVAPGAAIVGRRAAPLTPILSPEGERGRKPRRLRPARQRSAALADFAPSPLAGEGRGEGAARWR